MTRSVTLSGASRHEGSPPAAKGRFFGRFTPSHRPDVLRENDMIWEHP